jgi:hypothetical protein
MLGTSTPAPVPNPHAQALQACIREALAEGPGMVHRWVQGLLAELRVAEEGARNYREKTALVEAGRTLATHRQRLEEGFVDQWAKAIQESLKNGGVVGASPSGRALSQLRFDELELMDDDQVQATVEVARVQQAVLVASDRALADLSSRLSKAQGFGVVKQEQNPLRPEVVIQALARTLEGVSQNAAVRSQWLQQGSKALAAELDVLYRHLGRLLDKQGVGLADYAVVQTAPAHGQRRSGSGLPSSGPSGSAFRPPDGADRSPGPASDFWADQPPPSYDDFRPSSLLTLNHLHRLLVSNPVPPSVQAITPVPVSVQPPAQGQAQTPASIQTPAQASAQTTAVGRGAIRPESVVRPMSAVVPEPPAVTVQQPAPADVAGSTAAAAPSPAGAAPLEVPAPTSYVGMERRRRDRDPTRSPTTINLDQVEAGQMADLAEEVVGMMLDGIARDQRLLPPVSDALRSLRPLFLRIARDQPRFFADRDNPARRLLDEMTQQSMAFTSPLDSGFGEFVGVLKNVVGRLLETDGHATAVVEKALHALQAGGDLEAVVADRAQAQDRAVASLLQAEQRFLLAEKVADEMRSRKDFARAPAFMQQFLTGPWSQVVAWARLQPPSTQAKTDGHVNPDMRYTGLVSDLLWSCRADVAARNRSRLVRVIPLLLRNLREGLQTIEYPQEKSCDFFNHLMVQHEVVLKADVEALLPVAAPAAAPPPPVRAAARTPVAEPALWMRPSESLESGFMDLPESEPEVAPEPMLDFADTVPMPLLDEPVAQQSTAPDLTVGSWVELLQSSGEWRRAKLAWASPHGTMYLFTIAGGKSMSMTRRSFESLCQQHRMRMVASQSVVDDALDGVMNAAVRNSTARG